MSPLPRPFTDGSSRLRFVFQMALATRDRGLLVALRGFLGVGSIHDSPARDERWLPQSIFSVRSLKSNLAAVVPFADRYLMTSAKRAQYELWREQLFAYIEAHPEVRRVRSICSVEGCGKPVRGRGLCRSHYYELTSY